MSPIFQSENQMSIASRTLVSIVLALTPLLATANPGKIGLIRDTCWGGSLDVIRGRTVGLWPLRTIFGMLTGSGIQKEMRQSMHRSSLGTSAGESSCLWTGRSRKRSAFLRATMS